MTAARRYSDQIFEEDDDDRVENNKTSRELLRDGRQLLEDEAEDERLLIENSKSGKPRMGLLSRFRDSSPSSRHEHQRLRKSIRRRGNAREIDGERETIYKIEEGGSRSDSPVSTTSSEAFERQLSEKAFGRQRSRSSRCCKFALIHVLIAIAFVVIAFGAFLATRKRSSLSIDPKAVVSNGTHYFAPTTILISLDGFRADFLQRGLTPTLNSFIKEGVSPLYMLPSFPSVTFPNHYTLVTGLYPESHGVVGNSFWDPDLQEEFYYTDPARSMKPKWWGGEPLWLTAEEQGLLTAIHMWPGSEAGIGSIQPTYLDKFNGDELLTRKTERILELLDLPGPLDAVGALEKERPQFIASYVPNVDADGHLYGPNSTEIRQTITDVDNMLQHIFDGLKERNLTKIVNVVVVSDHGMATTSSRRLIQLEELIDPNKIEHIDGWPHYGLRLKASEDLTAIYERLKEESTRREGFDVFLRDKDMPKRYHFSNNDRIAPLWIMPKAQWAIVTKDQFDVNKGLLNLQVYHPKGLHGYDHEHPLMRSIFVARGPAFPHEPNSKLEVFQNTEVYNIICDSLGIEPKANNGTLRLPLKTVGLHDEKPLMDYETGVSTTEPMFGIQTAAPEPPTAEASSSPKRPVINDEKTDPNETVETLLDWFKAKIEDMTTWAHGLFDKAKSRIKGDEGLDPSQESTMS